ncbi:MAG: hypothetical protein AAF356_05410 [Planctomycetota bacterium]
MPSKPSKHFKRPASALALAGACGLAPLASAELPQVLDRVPGDAPLVIVADSIAGTLDDVVALNALAGPELMDPQIPMFAAILKGLPGLDASAPAAFAVDMDKLDALADADPWAEGDDWDNEDAAPPAGPESAIVAIVRTTDAALLERSIKSFGAQGLVIHVRDLGDGLAALGTDRAVVDRYDPTPGQLGAHTARLGPVGQRVDAASELLVIADPATFAPLMQEQVQSAVFGQMGMMMMMAGQNPAEAITPINEVITNWGEQAASGLIGVSYSGEGGLVLDVAAPFNEGTPLNAAMTHTGDAATMLSRVPGGSYYATIAADLRLPLVGEVFGRVLAGQEDGVLPGLKTAIDSGTGAVFVAPESPAGLLRNSVLVVRTDEPQATADAFAGAIRGLKTPADSPLIVTGTYEDDATTVEGVTADAYGLKMRPSEDAQRQAAAMGPFGQFMDPSFFNALLYGDATGFRGFAAPIDDAVLFTMSRSEPRLGTAIGAAGGTNALASDERVAGALAKLPEGASLVLLTHAEQLEQITQTLMFQLGFGEAPRAVETADPVAIGVAAIDGSTHARIVLPGHLIETIIAAGAADDQMQGGPVQPAQPRRGLPF